MKNDLEILAPAGDEQSFFAAVNNGANAIYLGLQNFNARNKAANFTLDNLQEFVNIAHLFNIKIYMVVNTLVTNKEMKEVLMLVKGAIKASVDAFIVQDLGVALVLKNTFKGIVLHASTQMGIHSVYGAKVAEKMGFSRVVLSREVTKQDIIDIKRNTNLELEYFVHGALCVAFSGNCYLSSLCFNESGNRGRCLQPCRLKYSSFSNNKLLKKGYLFSANDLCLIDKLEELKQLGICSVKIEGRLRRPSYVAYITNSYNKAKCVPNNESLLQAKLRAENFKKLFNRGDYNTGFYLDGQPNIKTINTKFQNHRGVKIGSVKKVKNFKDIYEVLIETNNYEIKKNDGLKCIYNNQELSFGVGSVKSINKNEYIVFTKINPNINSEVYLTVDSKWEETLLENIAKINFNAEFIANINEKAKLILTAKNVKVEVTTPQVLEQAKNSALTKDEVLENLKKTKNTFFELNNFACKLQNVFMPKLMLNKLRREAFSKLQEELIKEYEKTNLKPIIEDYNFYNALFANENNIAGNENSLFNKNTNIVFEKNNLEGNALGTNNTCSFENFICFNEFTNLNDIKKHFKKDTKLVFSPTNFCEENIKKYFNNFKKHFNVSKIFLNLPKVLRGEDLIIVEDIIKSFSVNELGLIANNVAHLHFASFGYEVIGGVYLNITNKASVEALKLFNVLKYINSFENFSSINSGLTFVGSVEVMTFCHCPYKTNFENENCNNCKFNNSLKVVAENGKNYNIRRIKIKNCIFELVSEDKINLDKIKNNAIFLDLRD